MGGSTTLRTTSTAGLTPLRRSGGPQRRMDGLEIRLNVVHNDASSIKRANKDGEGLLDRAYVERKG
jgi:hypothetical protein